MEYSAQLVIFTTWLMVGGGIVFVFSLVSCNQFFANGRKMGLAKTIALVAFWISFYGAYMNPYLENIW